MNKCQLIDKLCELCDENMKKNYQHSQSTKMIFCNVVSAIKNELFKKDNNELSMMIKNDDMHKNLVKHGFGKCEEIVKLYKLFKYLIGQEWKEKISKRHLTEQMSYDRMNNI